jgi:Na+-transporting NADH:ubiquinone oxidoreductase subunit NqrB
MADLQTTIHNERVKLTATLLNGLAIAIFAVGGLAPGFTMLYGDRQVTLPLVLGILVCFLVAPALHYWARRSMKGLRE